MDTTLPETPKPNFFHTHKVLYLILGLLLLGIWGYSSMSAPTNNRSRANRQPTVIHVAAGESLSSVAKELENRNIVKHGFILKLFITILNLDRQVEKGDYLFNENMPVWSVAWMLARSDHRVDPIKITFKEGITNNEMADILSEKLATFRKDLFLSDERAREGYLYPDTYFFFNYTTASEILSDISGNFTRRISSYKEDIANSGHSLNEIIVMASILEKEAKGKDDAGVISGILWKRLKLGMPLQVDAAKETYSKVGLPSSPIANPGASTIEAALNLVDSAYLFYLHGKDGNAHYAKTFSEHKSNINKYLR